MARNSLLLLLTFITLLTQFENVLGLNILAIVSLPLRSHYMAFQGFFRELAVRGHSVTVINNYPDTNPPPNLRFVNISVPPPKHRYTTILPLSVFENQYMSIMHVLNFQRHFVLGVGSTKLDCENLFLNENVRAFRDRQEKFDVIFVEQFMSDCGLAFAAALYDAPIIGITSHTMLPWAYPRLGLPFDFSSDAFYFSNVGKNPSLYKQVESFLLNLYMQTLGRRSVHRNIYATFDKYLPDHQLDIEKIAKEKMKMMFVYQHYSITGARLLSPRLLEIAGIHIPKSKSKIPAYIEEFISSAEHGVVYVSFGTNLNTDTMSSEKLQHFVNAFKKIPQKVIWKVENVTLPPGNENVLTSNWFPQLDILCHPNVLAFVSHGGMLSLSESAHCGKPLLTIPFFGDQYSNSAAVQDSGIGTRMYFQQVTADSLSEAIKYLTSKKMRENANRISKLWHDRPQNAMDSAIYWTEYVGKHRDAPPALPSTDATWFDRSLLGVYSVLIGILLAIVLILYIIHRILKKILVALFKLFLTQNKLNDNVKHKHA